MSRRQFAFLMCFLAVWLWATMGFLIMLGAIVAGTFGYLVVLVLEGELDLRSITDRFSSPRR